MLAKPCRNAFRRARDFPRAVLGPLLRLAFIRFAAILRSEVIADCSTSQDRRNQHRLRPRRFDRAKGVCLDDRLPHHEPDDFITAKFCIAPAATRPRLDGAAGAPAQGSIQL